MQQRRLRLGDILDDYCPRERRVTNHVAVAIVDEDVRQTRCTTCDAEHEYRHGKAPAPRRPKAAGGLAGDAPDGARPVLATRSEPELEADQQASEVVEDMVASPPPEPASIDEPPSFAPSLEAAPSDVTESVDGREDDGPVHRRLIRATFPRPEGHVPERREPEFTVRQSGGRQDADGNRAGYRSRGQQGQQGQGFGGSRGFGRQPNGGGFGSDQRGGRGPGGRGGGSRPGGGGGGGGFGRGPRQGGGSGRKGGR